MKYEANPGSERSYRLAPVVSYTAEVPPICLRRGVCLLLLILLASFVGAAACNAQVGNNQVELLIARTEVNDPYFHHSVVLMLPETETQLVVGLIINKPTRLTVGKLFPDSPELRGLTDSAYFGGPVDVRTPSIVFRSSSTPDNAVKLFGNVYLTFDSDLIMKAFQRSRPASSTRLFLGRAQWSPGQLQNEIRQGGWYRLQAEGNLVFSTHPDTLWSKLHARAAPNKFIRFEMRPGREQPSTPKAAM